MAQKYLFMTGGIFSSLGKGLASAPIQAHPLFKAFIGALLHG